MQPSIHNGFYRRNGCPLPPLYPSLQRGLVASYAPLLGRQGNKLFDWSGYGRHGTLTNMDAGTDWVPASVSGASGYALDFDGANDHALIGSTAPAIYPTGSEPRSVSAWINPNSVSGFRAIVGWGGSANNSEFCFCLNGLRLSFDFWFAADTSLDTVVANVWSHVGATWDGTTLRYYVNGRNDTYNDATPTLTTNTVGATIGKRPAQNNYYFSGSIASVAIHNRALSAGEFRQLAADPLALYRYQVPDYGYVAGVTGGFNAAWARRRFATRYGVSLR